MEKTTVFLLFMLVTLGYLVYKTRTKRKLSGFFLTCFAILLCMLLTEFIYRNFLQGKRSYSTVNSYFQQDSLMGYKFKDTGRLKATEFFIGGDTIYSTWYTVLSDTSRSGFNYPFRKSYRDSSNNKETVFLGCSVTMGECLPDEETLPYQYGKLTGTSTVNRGYNGFGIHQVYQTFLFNYANRDNHNRVFVYSFLSDHLTRATGIYVWNMAGPYFTISGDSLIFKGPLMNYKKIKGLKLAYYASFFGAFTIIRDNIERIALERSVNELTEKDYAPGYLMLAKMAETIKKTGGKLVILNWDSGHKTKTNSPLFNQDSINSRLAKAVQPYDVSILNVSTVLDFSDKHYFVPNDGHPAAITDSLLASYLAKNIQ